MKWRRGLLFAIIQIGIAMPLIVWQDAQQWSDLRNRPCGPDPPRKTDYRMGKVPASLALPQLPSSVVPDDGETVGFTPETICYFTPMPVRIVQGADLPAFLAAGWQTPLPLEHSIAGEMHTFCGPEPRRQTEIFISASLLVLIFLQWLVLGALPPLAVKPKWLDPPVFITLCAAIGLLGMLSPRLEIVRGVPALIALLSWLIWLVWFLRLLAKAGKYIWYRFTLKERIG